MKILTVRGLVATGAALLWLLAANALSAQEINPPRRPPGLGGSSQEPPVPATTYDPERVRMHLLAIHGFTREQLEAASTEVDQVLRGLIDGPGEPVVVKRQAIKALRHYPSVENLDFIAARLSGAPPTLQRLFLGTLEKFPARTDGRMQGLVEPLLESSDLSVRHAAVGLAATLEATPRLRSALEAVLSGETDPTLKNSIRGLLERLR